MIITIILLAIALICSLYTNWNILKKYEQSEDYVENLETWVNEFSKTITDMNREMKKIDTRLSNKSFMDRAPQNIVDQEKSNFANLEKDVKKIELTLKGL